MHKFGLVLFGFIASFWIFHGLRVALGAMRLPWLKDFPPADAAECPRISLIFAARDEEEKLPAALATLAAIDYPHLEILAVDDRSTDSTGRFLDDFASRHNRLKAVHVSELPPGWLGKPHALQTAYQASNGEWLLFTDADVRFAPDCLRRAMAMVQKLKLDHLTLMGDVEMHGFWETVLISFFGLGFYLAVNPADAPKARSRCFVGIGAFQLVRRSAYEASGAHRRLAMEVVDDMKLGKIVKQSGFRSGAGVAQDAVAVRWHSGASNIIRGVTKNFFAVASYRVSLVAALVAGVLLMNVLPFAGIVLGHGPIRILSIVSVLVAVGFHAGVAMVMRASPIYALTHPIGALLLCYMLLRSTVVTLKHGGVTWRGTFYPLAELRRGSV